MGYPDIERAREGQAALRRIFDGYVGPRADRGALRRAGPRALGRVVDLCTEVSDALDDDYCREKVRAVADYGAELLSQAEPRARGAVSGLAFLRQQIHAALELLQSRLYSLERARRYGQLTRASFAPSAFKR